MANPARRDDGCCSGRLDDIVAELITKHDGVRPVEQGEGDSFVVAFTRASDAVACALDLQRADLAPIRLRIGVHTGDIQLRDEGNYVGPTINRCGRLRDLTHGGQTVLSGVTEEIILDQLPTGSWLTDLGTHQLRDLPRSQRIVQLCHPEVGNDFPPLRTSKPAASNHLPAQLTSFIGRAAQIGEVRQLVEDNRLVTLTGAGGVGKTRLAIQVAAASTFDDGVWWVDLAPIGDPDGVPVTTLRALGVPDQPGQTAIDTLLRFMTERQMLVVLDNCEHVLDASAALVETLLSGTTNVTVLATSREPIGVAGESIWRVPSLSLEGEAVELFTDRARLARPDFHVTTGNATTVTEICQRLDGVPLAIELAAARVRALTVAQIADSLHDRFRLLTGGARAAVRRQQTLRASVDWSHALLTEPERVLFRRLGVFVGGFDLDAAQAVGAENKIERFQVLDLLGLLIDKSLVLAEDQDGTMRYRLLETVRQYAQEKLGESGEADVIRTRHCDHYRGLAESDQAEAEIDNLRTAFTWSRESEDISTALEIASGRIRSGRPVDVTKKDWRGLTRSLPNKTFTMPEYLLQCAREHSPTR